MSTPHVENLVDMSAKQCQAQADREGITQADTGLGTTYERWAMNQVLARLDTEAGFRTAFEGPGDGMTGIAGINSLILGKRGVHVTLALQHAAQACLARQVWNHHAPEAHLEILEMGGQPFEPWELNLPFSDNSFDLVWNFNVMPRFHQPPAALQELVRITQRYLLIFVPNRLNYSFWLHRLHHRVSGEPWDHGSVELMHPTPWKKMFARLGMRVKEIIWADCPWWPDIVNLHQLLGDFFPLLRKPPFTRILQKTEPESRLRWPPENLPYYHPDQYPQLFRQMESLAYFERTRAQAVKQRFAHHVGILAEKVSREETL